MKKTKTIHPFFKLVGFILLACLMGLEFNDTPIANIQTPYEETQLGL